MALLCVTCSGYRRSASARAANCDSQAAGQIGRPLMLSGIQQTRHAHSRRHWLSGMLVASAAVLTGTLKRHGCRAVPADVSIKRVVNIECRVNPVVIATHNELGGTVDDESLRKILVNLVPC